MSRIILLSSGSYFFEPSIEAFLPQPLEKSHIAYITTASKSVPNTTYIEKRRIAMQEHKLSYIEIDIEEETSTSLRQKLNSTNIIFVEGGNTFYLLRAVRNIKFESIVKEFLKEKNNTYIGSSAGAYIACPNIEVATWSTRNNFDRAGITNDYTAMGLVPFCVKAHVIPEMIPMIKEKVDTLEYPLRLLTDNQALCIVENNTTLIGSGEEITLTTSPS